MAALVDYALWDQWLNALRRDSQLPSVQSQFTDQDLLDIAWEQVTRVLAPLLIRARPSFFRETYDITLVADQPTYLIPPFAMLNKLHLAHLRDTTGLVNKLHRREPGEDEFFYEVTSGHARGIRLHDKRIELNPAPSAGDISIWPTLRTWIHRRPSRFVRATDDGSGNNPARAARVLSVVGDVVTYDTLMPSSFDATSVHDFYSQTAPYERVATSVAALTAPSTSSQTFATATAALLQAGDWVCLENETVFMPVPVDFAGHIKDLVIASMGKTQADQKAYESAMKACADDVRNLVTTTADPMTENPLTATLRHSPFLSAIAGRGRGMVRY